MIPDVTEFEILPDYKIKVTLSNGNKGIFDVKPYLDRGSLRNCETTPTSKEPESNSELSHGRTNRISAPKQ